MEKDSKCSENETLVCPTCKMQIKREQIGERCPRCNSVIMPKSCEGCKNVCK